MENGLFAYLYSISPEQRKNKGLAMLKNLVLTIEYDGTDFHGWQVQKDQRTVQGEIEAALARITCSAIRINGSGRTDAGVHALGQVANFTTDTRLDAKTLQTALNSVLPDDITIIGCTEARPDFHARFDAKDKTYEYRILNRSLPSALSRRFCWHIRTPLDINSMQEALALTEGTHDFSGFENSGSKRSHAVRTMFSTCISRHGDVISIRLTADGFLRCMVRNIVGTLVEVGLGKRSVSGFAEVLEKKNRGLGGTTAPAHGLFLVRVRYP